MSAGIRPWYWRCYKTMKYILGEQASAGYFNSPFVASTMQVTPSLIGAIPSDINHISCPKNSSNGNVNVSNAIHQDPIHLSFESLGNGCKPSNNRICTHRSTILFCQCFFPPQPIEVCTRVEFLTSPANVSAPTNPSPVHLTVANGTNAYNILKLAATKNPCYNFTAKLSAFGHFITSICGVFQEPANKKYWMIYSDNNTLTPTGVDNYRPKDGTCVIFKFQKLNFR